MRIIKTTIVTMICCWVAGNVQAQTATRPVFKVVEKLAQPKVGEKAFGQEMRKLTNFPKGRKKVVAFLSFVVELNGTISDIKLLRKLDAQNNASAIKALKDATAKTGGWIPAQHRGKSVRSRRSIRMVLMSENPKKRRVLRQVGAPKKKMVVREVVAPKKLSKNDYNQKAKYHFAQYLTSPTTKEMSSLIPAFMQWTNAHNAEAVAKAIPQVHPDTKYWKSLVMFTNDLFIHKTKKVDLYLNSLLQIENKMTQPNSQASIWQEIAIVYLLKQNYPKAEQYAQKAFDISDKTSVPISKKSNGLLYETKNLKIGSPAPPFKVKTLKNKELSTLDLKGKVIVVDFWASWCRPCIAEMPDLNKVYQKYKNRSDFALLGISLDTKESFLNKALARYTMPWIQVCDMQGFDGEISQKYNVMAIPRTVVIDKKGNLRALGLRPKEMPALLDKLFNE